MPEYDFSGLYDYDLELLARDLLNRDLDLNLQSFKSGRDRGIDLRYSGTSGQDIVVQCKHYLKSGSKKLIADLKKEVEKVEKIKPRRYIVVTSCPLSAVEKDVICDLFKPYCKSSDDVFSGSDLNRLIIKHPDIEKSHFKLWLTSSNVLTIFVNSTVINRTREQLKNIAEKAKIYVPSNSFLIAKEKLEKFNFCIISGIPGVGKTTLGEMLLIDYVSQGYEAVYLSQDVNEGFALYQQDKRQVFYFDDFFGKTKLEISGKNEDKRFIEFIMAVQRDSSKRLILSSRDYILKQAFEGYEDLGRDKDRILKANHIITFESYSIKHRAQILYNHLAYNNVSVQCISSIVAEKRYKTIVSHKNYVPRIIEWVINRVGDYVPAEFGSAFITALDNPLEIWKNAFEKHISDLSRLTLFAMFSHKSYIDAQDLSSAVDKLIDNLPKLSINRQYNDFPMTLREIDGTFVRCVENKNSIRVYYHNPAISDFIEHTIESQPTIKHAILESIVNVEEIWSYGEGLNIFSEPLSHKSEETVNFAIKIFESLITNFDKSSKKLYLENLGFRESPDALIFQYTKFHQHSRWMASISESRYHKLADIIVKYIEKLFNSGIYYVSDESIKMTVVSNMLNYYGKSEIIAELTDSYVKTIFEELSEVYKAAEFFRLFLNHRKIFNENTIDRFIEAIYVNCDQYVANAMVSDSRREVETTLNVISNLEDCVSIEELASQHSQLQRRLELIEDGTIEDSDYNDRDDYDEGDLFSKYDRVSLIDEWDGVEDMFDGLDS